MAILPTNLSRKPGLYGAPGKRVQRVPKEQRTDAEGVTFDSALEMRRWEELKLLQRAGEISGLERQRVFVLAYDGRPVLMRSARYPNGRVCKYHADFHYLDKAGKPVFEECKGPLDSEADRLRRAVVESMYQIEIIVTGPAASKTPRRRG